MLIAQITDLHCTAEGTRALGRFDTNAALEAAVAHVNRLRPDLVVVTGDIVNGPAPGEYAAAAPRLSRLEAPWLPIPGNHDDREGMRDAFGHLGLFPAGGEFLHYVHEAGPLRVLALDTVVAGRVEGRLCGDRLSWIAARLAEVPERPTLVIMHHPPFACGIGFMDAIRCEGADALAAILRPYPIAGVLCGHNHRATAVGFAGTVAFGAPSTAFQMALDLRPEAPPRWTAEPPAIAVHLWEPGHGLRSHVSQVGDWEWRGFA